MNPTPILDKEPVFLSSTYKKTESFKCMNGCEHLCSAYGIHLKLECFLSGEREKANAAASVRLI